MKKLLIASFGLVACGTTALATGNYGSLTAELQCPGPKLYVTAHQHGTELRDLGSGILEFSGPSHISDVTWHWDAYGGDEQVIAAFYLPKGIKSGTYTAWLEDHSQPYRTYFEVYYCDPEPTPTPTPTPTATPTPTPTPTATPTATPTGGVGGATPPPAGGVAAAVLPNTGAEIPLGLGIGLIALGLAILAGAALLLGRRSA